MLSLRLRMTLRRALVLALLATLVGAGIVGVIYVKRAVARAQTVALSPPLVVALEDIERREYARPVHRGIVKPGNFGDAVEASLPEIPDPFSNDHFCPATSSTADPACRTFLDETRTSLTKLLDATTRSTGGLGARRSIMAPLSSGKAMPLPAFVVEQLGVNAVPIADMTVSRMSLGVCKRAGPRCWSHMARVRTQCMAGPTLIVSVKSVVLT
jgi:hypothetical protein